MPFITNPNNWILPVSLFVFTLFLTKLFKPMLSNCPIKEGLKELHFFGKKIFLLIILILIALGIGDYVNHKIFKPFFARIRPCNILPQVKLLVHCTSSFSFPSSHAVNIFAIATVISSQFRVYTPLLLLTAVTVCYSRVYVGVHYPFDVVVGGLYGICCGIMVILIKEKLLKKIGISLNERNKILE